MSLLRLCLSEWLPAVFVFFGSVKLIKLKLVTGWSCSRDLFLQQDIFCFKWHKPDRQRSGQQAGDESEPFYASTPTELRHLTVRWVLKSVTSISPLRPQVINEPVSCMSHRPDCYRTHTHTHSTWDTIIFCLYFCLLLDLLHQFPRFDVIMCHKRVLESLYRNYTQM